MILKHNWTMINPSITFTPTNYEIQCDYEGFLTNIDSQPLYSLLYTRVCVCVCVSPALLHCLFICSIPQILWAL